MTNSTWIDEDKGKKLSHLNISLLILSMLAGIITIYLFFIWVVKPDLSTIKVNPEILALKKNIEELQRLTAEEQKRIDALLLIKPKNQTTVDQQIAVIRVEIQTVASRLDALEKGLLDNPEKAVSLPLLRNDLQNLKQTYRQDLDTIVKNIDRVYDQNKWFIGLMFTMAIGLLGLAINNILQTQKSQKSK